MTKRWPSSDTIVTMSSIVTSLFRNTASTNALLLLSLASAYILIRLIMAPRSRVENSSTTARTESDAVRKLKFILPKLPLLTRVTLLRIMGLSEPAKYMDLYSELTLNVIRFYTIPARPRTITQVQAILNTDRPSKGRVWISRVASPVPPEDGIRDALRTAVESLAAEAGIAEDALAFKWPDLVPVEAEWTGYRSAASADARLPEHLTQRQLYDELMREATRPTTVLYFHGGAHYLLDPSTHRHATKTLAKLTGGRCYSVRYRLAPQNPFPAGLLDAFVAYFTLLYPPPGSFHEPVRPEHIVFAGDSAGGNICLALLQLLLTLRRGDEAASIPWFGTARTVPLPAGVAVCSPWLDVSQSSPSWKASHSQATAFDYLPPAPDPTSRSDLFFRRLPPCAAWPPDPKVGSRSSIYAPRDGLLAHPLVSPALATDWTGAPPLWIACGWERIADECRYLAAKMARDIDASAAAAAERSASISSRVEPGIRRTSSGRGRRRAAAAGSGSANGTTTTTITTTTTKTKKAQPPPPQPSSQASSVVRLEQYEAMPHAFGLIMRRTDGAPWRCNERWAKFISACVEAPETLREQKQQRSKGHCEFITFAARSLTESVRPLSEASTVDEASFRREVAARIDALVKGRMEIEEEKRQKESRGRKALSVCW